FDDHTEQTINFEPVLGGELLRPLRNLDLFNQVKLDQEVHTLVWPNGADFDPATLHDWPNRFRPGSPGYKNGNRHQLRAAVESSYRLGTPVHPPPRLWFRLQDRIEG